MHLSWGPKTTAYTQESQYWGIKAGFWAPCTLHPYGESSKLIKLSSRPEPQRKGVLSQRLGRGVALSDSWDPSGWSSG